MHNQEFWNKIKENYAPNGFGPNSKTEKMLGIKSTNWWKAAMTSQELQSTNGHELFCSIQCSWLDPRPVSNNRTLWEVMVHSNWCNRPTSSHFDVDFGNLKRRGNYIRSTTTKECGSTDTGDDSGGERRRRWDGSRARALRKWRIR